MHVPTVEHTTTSLARARDALAETQQRHAIEARQAAEYAHSQQLTRWQTEDHAADTPGSAARHDRPQPSRGNPHHQLNADYDHEPVAQR